MRRRDNKRRGLMAEQRTKEHLERYGKVEQVPLPWSNPDLVWKPRDKLVGYAVEVKSVLGITKCKAGRIWITKAQWKKVRNFAKENELIPCMIVELLGGRTKGYWMISADAIETKMRKASTYTVWQIVNVYGKRID